MKKQAIAFRLGPDHVAMIKRHAAEQDISQIKLVSLLLDHFDRIPSFEKRERFLESVAPLSLLRRKHDRT